MFRVAFVIYNHLKWCCNQQTDISLIYKDLVGLVQLLSITESGPTGGSQEILFGTPNKLKKKKL